MSNKTIPFSGDASIKNVATSGPFSGCVKYVGQAMILEVSMDRRITSGISLHTDPSDDVIEDAYGKLKSAINKTLLGYIDALFNELEKVDVKLLYKTNDIKDEPKIF